MFSVGKEKFLDEAEIFRDSVKLNFSCLKLLV